MAHARQSRYRNCLLGLLATALMLPRVQAEPAAEYAAKAAFVYNIVLFASFDKATPSPLRLCVLGRNPFGNALTALDGKSVGPAKLAIGYPRSGTEAMRQCQVVFISESEAADLRELAENAKDAGVLTVADIPGAARQGVVVELGIEDRRIVFEYNGEAARAARITLSSKVLRLAKAVY